MRSHYCKVEQGQVLFEGECNWCGEKEIKDLTDEEIQKAMEFAGIHPSKQWGLATTGNVQLMIFARAILRKAQEK